MTPAYRRPDDLAVVEGSDLGAEQQVVYVAPLPDGPISLLEGPAAIIWHEAQSGPGDLIAERVAERAGVPVADVQSDVATFLDDLLRRGLLVEVSD